MIETLIGVMFLSTAPSIIPEIYEKPVIEIPFINQRAIYPQPKETAGTFTYKECSCVSFVRDKVDFNFPRIRYAKDLPPIRQEPRVGGIVIFNDPPYGHLAYIEAVGNSAIKVSEYNYKKCKYTTREIDIYSPNIIGYFYKSW